MNSTLVQLTLILIIFVKYSKNATFTEKTIINLTKNQTNLIVTLENLLRVTSFNLSLQENFQNLTFSNNSISLNENYPAAIFENQPQEVLIAKRYKKEKIVDNIYVNTMMFYNNTTILPEESIIFGEERFNESLWENETHLNNQTKENKVGMVVLKYPNLNFLDTVYSKKIGEDKFASLGNVILGFSKKGFNGFKAFFEVNNFLKEKKFFHNLIVKNIFTSEKNLTVSNKLLVEGNYFVFLKYDEKYVIAEVNFNFLNFTEKISSNLIKISSQLISDNVIENYFYQNDFHVISLLNRGFLLFNNNGQLNGSIAEFTLQNKNKSKSLELIKTIYHEKIIFGLVRELGIIRCDIFSKKCEELIFLQNIINFEVSDQNELLLLFGENPENLLYLNLAMSQSNNSITSVKKAIFKESHFLQTSTKLIYHKDFLYILDSNSHSLTIISNKKDSNDRNVIFFKPHYNVPDGTSGFRDIFLTTDKNGEKRVSLLLLNNEIVFVRKAVVEHKILKVQFFVKGNYIVNLHSTIYNETDGKYILLRSSANFNIKDAPSGKGFFIGIESLFIMIFIIITVWVIARRVYSYSKHVNIEMKAIQGYQPTMTNDRSNILYDNSI